MANPSSISLVVAFAFLQTLTLIGAEPPESVNGLISLVCAGLEHPVSCFQSLGSDPRSAGADLEGLGLIAVDLARWSFRSTSILVRSLAQRNTDPATKGSFHTCSETYSLAISSLEKCREYLSDGDYDGLHVEASAGYTDVDTCNDAFLERGSPEPAELVQASKKLFDLVEIVEEVAIRLKNTN